MVEGDKYIEVNYRKTFLGLMVFPVANAIVGIGFGTLWVMEYRIPDPLADRIDLIVVPWLWLVCFFTASFLSLRGINPKPLSASVFFAIVFSVFLGLIVTFVLTPLFDPWF
jgi:hypothetical protein